MICCVVKFRRKRELRFALDRISTAPQDMCLNSLYRFTRISENSEESYYLIIVHATLDLCVYGWLSEIK